MRYCHAISPDVDLKGAIRLGREITPQCGSSFVPTYGSDVASRLPACAGCYTPSERQRMRTHYVYRCYDAADRLIYVGCTVDPRTRKEAHTTASWWFGQVARIRMTVFQGREYARAKEAQAIYEENPRWNVRSRNLQAFTLQDYRDFYTAIRNGPTGEASSRLARTQQAALQAFGVDIAAGGSA